MRAHRLQRESAQSADDERRAGGGERYARIVATEPAALAAQLRSLADAVGLLAQRVHDLAGQVDALPTQQLDADLAAEARRESVAERQQAGAR